MARRDGVTVVRPSVNRDATDFVSFATVSYNETHSESASTVYLNPISPKARNQDSGGASTWYLWIHLPTAIVPTNYSFVWLPISSFRLFTFGNGLAGSTLTGTATMYVYAQYTDWTPASLSWNNQPGLGTLALTQSLTATVPDDAPDHADTGAYQTAIIPLPTTGQTLYGMAITVSGTVGDMGEWVQATTAPYGY